MYEVLVEWYAEDGKTKKSDTFPSVEDALNFARQCLLNDIEICLMSRIND